MNAHLNALFAYLHYFCFAAGLALLVAEASLLPQLKKSPGLFKRLATIDGFYGLAALGSLASGLVRAVYTEKGIDYYLHNGFFYAKLATFTLAALISLGPTVFFFRRRLTATGATWNPHDTATLTRVWLAMGVQGFLYALIPLFGVLMARGYGVF